MEHNYFNIHYENCSFCFIIQNWLLSLEQQCRKIPTGTDGQLTASGYYPLWGSCINHTNDQLKAETYINNQYSCIIYRAKHRMALWFLLLCIVTGFLLLVIWQDFEKVGVSASKGSTCSNCCYLLFIITSEVKAAIFVLLASISLKCGTEGSFNRLN